MTADQIRPLLTPLLAEAYGPNCDSFVTPLRSDIFGLSRVGFCFICYTQPNRQAPIFFAYVCFYRNVTPERLRTLAHRAADIAINNPTNAKKLWHGGDYRSGYAR